MQNFDFPEFSDYFLKFLVKRIHIIMIITFTKELFALAIALLLPVVTIKLIVIAELLVLAEIVELIELFETVASVMEIPYVVLSVDVKELKKLLKYGELTRELT